MKSCIEQVIADCRQQFGHDVLFYGNCGMFAIALGRWVQTTFPTAEVALVGAVLVDDEMPRPLPLETLVGSDLNHVFLMVKEGESEWLYDGDGLVSEEALNAWFRSTWHQVGPGRDPEKFEVENGWQPTGCNLAFGELKDSIISQIEQDTAHSMVWQEFYACIDSR